MKKILIISGPNGAGKTTFAEEFLPHEADCPEFVNADLIAAGLSPFQPETVALAAGRLMLKRIDFLAAAGESFAFETTLSSRGYLRMIPQWQQAGYRVTLFFLKLPNPEFAIRRVENRVQLGGHDIPVPTIRRRFVRGWENLQRHYLAIVDDWAIYDGRRAPALLLETGSNASPDSIMEDSTRYRSADSGPVPTRPLDDPIFRGAEAALKRAAAKAIKRARAAGLKPVVATTETTPTEVS